MGGPFDADRTPVLSPPGFAKLVAWSVRLTAHPAL